MTRTVDGDDDAFVLFDQSLAGLDAEALLRVIRLRCDVFVVEQACPYPEVDDHDAVATTRHVWLSPTDQSSVVASYLRVISPGEHEQRIGRVVTAPAWRGRGLGAKLMRAVLARYPARTVLDAQSHLQHFYEQFGFGVVGPEFLEDGIPHVPMRRPVQLEPERRGQGR